jgi:flagellar basal-body rod protein FlgB
VPISGTDNITNLLQSFLNVQSRRSEVIAGNIANADTPGYAAKELDFDGYLREAVRTSALPQAQREQAAQGLGAELRVREQTPTAIGLDGNTVDAGREMSELAQAGTNFNFGAKMIQSRFRLLRAAIREGR